MDDPKVGMSEEEQRARKLLPELARQVQRDAAEVRVPQQVVEVVGEELKDETQMFLPNEVRLQFH